MAEYLTVADLAAFLRGRKSADSKIVADWVEEFPEHPAALAAVDMLEGYVLSEDSDASFRHAAVHNGVLDQGERLSALLGCAAPRYILTTLTTEAREGWSELFRLAHDRASRRMPGWAAAIVRRIKQAQVPAPLATSADEDEKGYIVEFLVVRRVKVQAFDELQAEREAFSKLSAADKAAVQQLRLLDANGVPLSRSGEFYPIDREWVED